MQQFFWRKTISDLSVFEGFSANKLGKEDNSIPTCFPFRPIDQPKTLHLARTPSSPVSQSVAGGDSPGTRSQLDTLVLSRDAIHDLQAEEEMGEGVKIPY